MNGRFSSFIYNCEISIPSAFRVYTFPRSLLILSTSWSLSTFLRSLYELLIPWGTSVFRDPLQEYITFPRSLYFRHRGVRYFAEIHSHSNDIPEKYMWISRWYTSPRGMSLYPVDMETRISTANLLQLLVLFLPTRTVQCHNVTRAPAPENMATQRIDVHHHFVPEFYAQGASKAVCIRSFPFPWKC